MLVDLTQAIVNPCVFDKICYHSSILENPIFTDKLRKSCKILNPHDSILDHLKNQTTDMKNTDKLSNWGSASDMRDLIDFASSPEGKEAFKKSVEDNVAKSDPTIKLSRIALKTFFNVASDWDLTPSEQMILLGGISKSSFYKYKKAPEDSIRPTRDVLYRTSYVAAIQHALFQYFETKKHLSCWISSKNTEIPFNGLSPLQYMLQGEMEQLSIVRQYTENLLI